MKRFFVIGGCLVVVCAVVALLVLRVVGLDPHERRPGLWLAGERVTTPVAEWSFTDQYPTIYLQTRARYLLPHSVTITSVAHGGQLTRRLPRGLSVPAGR
jgi:hypothetical protein